MVNAWAWVRGVTDNVGRILVILALFGVPAAAGAWLFDHARWGLIAGGIALVVGVLLEGAFRTWRDEVSARPVVLPAVEPDPEPDLVVDGLLEIHAEGLAAMATFKKSEGDLHIGEKFGKPPPQGRSYDDWHELGAQQLKDWLAIADWRAVEFVAGADRDMRERREKSPIKPVPSSVRGDYEDLWLDCAHRFDWLADEIHRRAPGRYFHQFY